MLVVPRIAERELIEAWGRRPLVLRRFIADVTPARSTTTVELPEPTGGEYASKMLAAEQWSVDLDPVHDRTIARYPPQTWTFGAGVGWVYGYAVTDVGGSLRWAERFQNGPFLCANPGDRVTFEPVFTLGPP